MCDYYKIKYDYIYSNWDKIFKIYYLNIAINLGNFSGFFCSCILNFIFDKSFQFRFK